MNRCMFWMKGNSRRGVVYIMTCCVLFFNMPLSVVLAAPQGGVFVPGYGSGTIVDNVQHSTVEVTSPRSIINWTSLDTAGGSDPAVRESLTFSQNGVINAAVLNRVSGVQTQFNGDLTGIGMSIFIVNPAGIMFGEGAAVNVSRLVASTLDIDNGDFMSDNYDFVVPGIGEVANYGTIEADQGAALIARKVLNNGTIKTGPEGFVVMAAGDRVLLGQPGSKIVVEMSSTAGEVEGAGDVINNGDIEAPGGQIVLAAGDIYSTVANAGSKAVKVYSGVGTVRQNGTVNADSDTGDGGTISLTAADEVALGPGSETTANAAPDSGGADPTPAGGEIVISSPKNVTADPDARLEAIGNGVLDNDNDGWLEPAEGDADFRGSVEVTGTHIVPPIDVDLSAHSGRPDDAGLLSVGPLMGDLYIANDGVPAIPAENTLYEDWVELMSQQGTNLDLFSYENIYVEHMTDGAIEGGTGDIALRNVFNDSGIEFESASDGLPTTTVSTSTGGDVFMLAGSEGILAGNIETSVGDHVGDPGRIRLFTNNHGNIETGHLTTDGGNHVEVSVVSSGDLTIHGDVISQTQEVPDPEDKTSSAQICLVAGRGVETDTGDVEIVTGDVLIEGSVIVTAHGKGETRSNIHIDAAVGQDQEPDTIGTITIDLGSEGQILAEAKTSGPALGEQADGTLTAEATIKMHAGAAQAEDGSEAIKIIGGKSGGTQAVQARADVKGKPGEVLTWDGESLEHSQETDEYEVHAQIEIESDWGDDPGEDCPDCPPPLWLPPPIDPIGVPDSATTHMGSPVSGNVLDNDVPSQGTVDLAAILVDEPSHGQLLSFDPETGDYTYLPDEGFVGTDSFTYMAIDSGTSGLISVSIEVTNEAPVANDDSASGHMGSAISDGLDAYDVADIIGDDSFIDDLSVSIDIEAVYGDVTIVWDEDSGSFIYTYTPESGNENYVGSDSFTYTVTDGAESATATISLALSNEGPVANNDSASGHMGSAVSDSLDAYDTADIVDGQSFIDDLSISIDTDAVYGDITIVWDEASESFIYTYTPESGNENYVGSDSFTYTVTDGAESATATISLALSNEGPVANNDSASGHMGSAITDTLDAYDTADIVDGQTFIDDLSVSIDTDAVYGDVTVVWDEASGDFVYTYTPEPGNEKYVGPDSFTYTVTDGAASATATVGIELTNAPPVATDESVTIRQGDSVGIDVLRNDYDPDNDPFEVIFFTYEGDGRLRLNRDQRFTFTPGEGFVGKLSFTYAVTDGEIGAEPSKAVVTITVNAALAPIPVIPAAPLPDPIVWEVAGCPALMGWLADELGLSGDKMQVTMLHAYSQAQGAVTNASAIGYKADIQWCKICADLQDAAAVLADAEGTAISALAEAFDNLAPAEAPFSEEMAASILTAFENAREGTQYATAKEFIDAFATYIALLDTQLGSPVGDSQAFVMTKYGSSIMESDNTNMAAFIAWRLQAPAGQ